MYYESIRLLLEKEFTEKHYTENQKIKALDKLNKISEHFDKLSRSKPIIYVSALAFFILEEEGTPKNFKEISLEFDIDPKKLTLKVKEIANILGLANTDELLMQGLILNPEKKEEKKSNPKNTPIIQLKELQNEDLVEIFKAFKPFVSTLFKDKDFIEIKLFLKLLETNLIATGYNIKTISLEKTFGELFMYLNFEPKKGREPEKFVSLKDRFGNYEPYTLIKIGE